MINRTSRAVAAVLCLSVLISACNLPLDGGADSLSQAAEATVQAELTRVAAEAQTELVPVAEGQTATPTETAPPPSATPPGPTPTSGVQGCTDRAAFVTDVTVPDGSDFSPGEAFVKTWRLRNEGSCDWSSSYDLVFVDGDMMGAPAEVPLPGVVSPGATVDLSVNLTAPGSEGGYKGNFKLRNSDGVLFGIGASADTAFWVEIEVLSPSPTPTEGLVLIPVITIFPLFYHSSGQDQVLSDGACFDLDGGSGIACGSGAADFAYDASLVASGGFPVTFQVEGDYALRNSTEVRYFGMSAPSKQQCDDLNLGSSDLKLAAGRYYCYETTDGRLGWLRAKSVQLDTLTFDWATFK